jgi:hypothetical protein
MTLTFCFLVMILCVSTFMVADLVGGMDSLLMFVIFFCMVVLPPVTLWLNS